MGFYILGYKQLHAAPPGAPRITRSRASPCPPAAPPDPAVAYIPGYMDGFQMWRSGSPHRPHSAAPVTPSAPKPRTPSQRSRHDIPVRPAVRLPPFASRRPRDATHAKASHSVPVFALRCPGSPRRSHSAAAVTPSAPRRLAPPRALRTERPPAPHLIEATRVSCDLRPLETLAFCAAAQEFGAPPQTPAGAQGERQPGGLLGRRPKATRSGAAKP